MRHHPRSAAGGSDRKTQFRLTLLLFAVAVVEHAAPAAAQLATGLGPPGTSPANGAPTAQPTANGAPGAGALPPGSSIPTILPPPPSGPFGLPNPLAPPNSLPYGVTPPTSAPPASGLSLPPPGAGITTLQAYNPNAPAVLITPLATVGARFTDNVRYTPTDHTAAVEGRLIPGISVSADTPRFQGVMSGQVEGDIYTPTGDLDQITANLFGRGTGTVVPDRLFVDMSSYLTQASSLPGLGFVSPSLLPRTQQTQVFANQVSPYLRQSFGGLLDTELRYRFGATNYGGTTTVTSTTIPAPNLANGILNEGTFTAATGRDFERALSRLTIDASNFNTISSARNEQVSAFDDLEYRIRPNISALARIGYQNQRYPFSPAATFAGPTWLAGGRLGSAAGYGFVSLEYGRVQGVYGFTGAANYQITPTITVQANLSQGISSPSQYLQTALSSSTLNPYGSVVDQYSGLPTAFYNPGLGLTNNVYRQHLYNAGISDRLNINTYSIFFYYINQQTLTAPITPPTNSTGASLTWARDIRPDLNGIASLTYARTTNVVTINTPTPLNNTSTVTANLGVNYLFGPALTGSVLYTLSYQPNGGVIVNGRSGDIVANSLQLLLTKAF